MNIQELYKKIENVGCFTFSTLGVNGEIQSRIAHFNGCDNDGIYFRTMVSKPYYRQLMGNGKLTVCGMTDNRVLDHMEDGTPVFPPSYVIRMVGEVKQVPYKVIVEKSKTNKDLITAAQDGVKYPTMKDANFVLYKAKVEIFDTDFEQNTRDNKVERIRFSFGDVKYNEAGPKITDKCISCGKCKNICSFNAIEVGKPYKIISSYCDDCGMCSTVCQENAIKESLEF